MRPPPSPLPSPLKCPACPQDDRHQTRWSKDLPLPNLRKVLGVFCSGGEGGGARRTGSGMLGVGVGGRKRSPSGVRVGAAGALCSGSPHAVMHPINGLQACEYLCTGPGMTRGSLPLTPPSQEWAQAALHVDQVFGTPKKLALPVRTLPRRPPGSAARGGMCMHARYVQPCVHACVAYPKLHAMNSW